MEPLIPLCCFQHRSGTRTRASSITRYVATRQKSSVFPSIPRAPSSPPGSLVVRRGLRPCCTSVKCLVLRTPLRVRITFVEKPYTCARCVKRTCRVPRVMPIGLRVLFSIAFIVEYDTAQSYLLYVNTLSHRSLPSPLHPPPLTTACLHPLLLCFSRHSAAQWTTPPSSGMSRPAPVCYFLLYVTCCCMFIKVCCLLFISPV